MCQTKSKPLTSSGFRGPVCFVSSHLIDSWRSKGKTHLEPGWCQKSLNWLKTSFSKSNNSLDCFQTPASLEEKSQKHVPLPFGFALGRSALRLEHLEFLAQLQDAGGPGAGFLQGPRVAQHLPTQPPRPSPWVRVRCVKRGCCQDGTYMQRSGLFQRTSNAQQVGL